MKRLDRQNPASLAVVEAVAEAEGVDPADLDPPLARVIDPDALDALFTDGSSGWMTFHYSGYAVTVHADGSVDVRERARGRDSHRRRAVVD